MPLILYNSQTRQKEPFNPLVEGQVKMYCCGVTVYDLCHLGHARSYVVWDTIRKYLQWRGFEVRYVQNFTDIDDKILNRAKEQGKTMAEVSNRYIEEYFTDIRTLNVQDADEYPRVTENIEGIHKIIQDLIDRGYAYVAGNDVYYSVERFPSYGKLSGRKLEEMQAGASGRVGGDTGQKKHPFDFALWKSAKAEEPSWDSPWGKGRPGWHIECSAMVRAILGDTVDIHGGGGDLIFPHHENEIAQSEAATNQPLASYWLHNGMVKIEGEKMSKSLGNFITIRDFLERPADPMGLRLFILQAHYRKPLDFTEEAIISAQNSWQTLKEGLTFGYSQNWQPNPTPLSNAYTQNFAEAMDDDFNTPTGLAVIFELAKTLRKEKNLLTHEGQTQTPLDILQEQWQTLVQLATVLGFNVQPQEDQNTGLSDEDIETLIQQRKTARQSKNFAEADRIRDELKAQNIILVDKPDGLTTWYRE